MISNETISLIFPYLLDSYFNDFAYSLPHKHEQKIPESKYTIQMKFSPNFDQMYLIVSYSNIFTDNKNAKCFHNQMSNQIKSN